MLSTGLHFLSQLSGRIIEASVQAVPVVALILLVQWLLGKILSPAARSNLWLVLAIYLAAPWLPATRFSPHFWSTMPAEIPGWSALAHHSFGPETSTGESSVESEPIDSAAVAPIKTAGWRLAEIAAVLWLAGFLAMATRFASGLAASNRILATSSPCRAPRTLATLSSCLRQMGCTRPIELWQSDALFGPAVIGVVKPRIVVPRTLLGSLAPTDLKHVLMHEIAHVRRHDMPQAWLMGALLALHWFNPLMWVASRRLRADREMACDAFVLSRAGGIEPDVYGATMINLLEQCQHPVAICSAAGILEYKTEIKKRITMIAGYQNTPAWKHVLSMSVCALLACLVLNRPARLGAASQTMPKIETFTNAEGHQEDRIDLPFVADPAVVGTWLSVAFVADPADFSPEKARQSQEKLFLKDLDFYSDGKTNWAWTWTQNYLLHAGDKTASRYEIFQAAGSTYLSLEWKSGDYTLFHQPPMYYILRKVSDTPRPRPQPIADNIDLPFVDDLSVSNTRWTSVDFVNSPGDFVPGKKRFGKKLFLKELVFNPGGKMDRDFISWTNGVVMHHGDKTASHYEIRQIDGSTYMFFEWKNGDYTLRGQQPRYYVLKKES